MRQDEIDAILNGAMVSATKSNDATSKEEETTDMSTQNEITGNEITQEEITALLNAMSKEEETTEMIARPILTQDEIDMLLNSATKINEEETEMTEVTTRTNEGTVEVKMTEEEVKIVADMAIATAISQGAVITEDQKLEVLNAIRAENGYAAIVVEKKAPMAIDKVKVAEFVRANYATSVAPLATNEKEALFEIIKGKTPKIENPSVELVSILNSCLKVVVEKSIDDKLQEEAAKMVAKVNTPKKSVEDWSRDITLYVKGGTKFTTNVAYGTTKAIVTGIIGGIKDGIKGKTPSIQDILKLRVK